jgi:hypothetical protein
VEESEAPSARDRDERGRGLRAHRQARGARGGGEDQASQRGRARGEGVEGGGQALRILGEVVPLQPEEVGLQAP